MIINLHFQGYVKSFFKHFINLLIYLADFLFNLPIKFYHFVNLELIPLISRIDYLICLLLDLSIKLFHSIILFFSLLYKFYHFVNLKLNPFNFLIILLFRLLLNLTINEFYLINLFFYYPINLIILITILDLDLLFYDYLLNYLHAQLFASLII